MPATETAAVVARRYDRIASVYDAFEAPMDWFGGRRRRRRVLMGATGRTLEVGIGTFRNLRLYPGDVRLVGVDLSKRMLVRARRRGGPALPLIQADVEHLPFPTGAFDTVTATCVFCSVTDPVAGLAEVGRVVNADGHVLLLEHVRPRSRIGGWLADRLSPLTRRLFGPSLNRRTEENARAAGLDLLDVSRAGIWRGITARPHGGRFPGANTPRTAREE